MLNQGQYQLPEPPKLSDFDQTLQDYKAQVQAEIAQEAAAAGMTVEEYAAAGYEAPQQDTFSIYQLRGGEETRDYQFEPYERLQAAGLTVDRANYDLVYTASLNQNTSLEDIYRTFNIDHPKDFKGHSLSVSDVVVLHQNGQDTAHYVDSFGFTQVPEFFIQREKQLTPVFIRKRESTAFRRLPEPLPVFPKAGSTKIQQPILVSFPEVPEPILCRKPAPQQVRSAAWTMKKP